MASIGDQTFVKLLKECKSLKEFYESLPPKRYI
jgi:5'-3' exonuclease